MADFFQQVVSGLASGGVYGSLALALVLIHRATGVINFAQGEMATFSTYIAWTLTTNHGLLVLAGVRGDPPRLVRRRLRHPPVASSARSSEGRRSAS